MSSGIERSSTIGSILSWNSPEWKIIHEWKLSDVKIARFLRAGNKLMSESVIDGKITREPFEQQLGEKRLSPEKIIAIISKRQAYINDDGTVDFLVAEKGVFNDVTITENDWGITVVDTGDDSCNDINPINWGGHAVIFIESIEEGSYKIKRADLKMSNPDMVVRCFEIEKTRKVVEAKFKNCSRSKTWIRSKKLVIRMMKQISLENERSKKNQTPLVDFCEKKIRFSFDTIGIIKDYNLINCLSWARYRAYLADIDMPLKLKMFSWETPKDYLGSKTQVVAQETFGFITKVLIGATTLGAISVVVIASGGSVALAPAVAMLPTGIPTWGLLNLWGSVGDRHRDYRWRDLFKNQVINGKL